MSPHTVGRFFRVFMCSLLISPIPFFHAQQSVHAATVPIIGEVSWAGSSLSSADEWLELWNNSDEPLMLAGYILRGAAPSDIIFDNTQIIPPRGTFLISNYIDTDPKCLIATTTQLVTTAISLSNSALNIELLAPDGSHVDNTGNGTPLAGSSLPTKTTMIHQVDGSWASATTSQNLDSGTTDFATPGFCDGCTTVTIAELPLPEPILEPIQDPIIDLPIIEIPTSTEPTVETSTSTEPVLEPLVGTSSTNIIIELPIYQPPTPAPVYAPMQNQAVITQTEPQLLYIQLLRVHPAPVSGSEWIDIEVPVQTTFAQTIGWSLRDASSAIFHFTETGDQISVSGTTWRISLSSARLNNSGDTVELVRADASIAERMNYPTTPHGTTWTKNVDHTSWNQDPLPTAPTPITTTDLYTSTPTIQTIIPQVSTREIPLILPITKETNDKTIITSTSTTTSIKSKKASTPTIKTTKVKVPTKKTNVLIKKSEPAPPLVTLDMLQQLEPEIRITIEGTVGTVTGILPKYQFILQTPDGRGLLVRGTSKQVSPDYGTKIRLTGTLSINDDGISLRMLSKDRWINLNETESIEPRVVDLIAPSQEDAWSLLQVTGTVLEVSSSKITLELNGIPLLVKIRPITGYRATRISKGDIIRIQGVLDTRTEDPILYPRTASDIEIMSHINLVPSTAIKTTLPAWTPFGAAGITVAVAESYKRLRRLAKDRKLKRLAALAQ